MKTYCILEQSGVKGDTLTRRKKELFTTEFSDFYRLNWRDESDPYATMFEPDIVWSEGRSCLYEAVPREYEYYIFTDDDIEFNAEQNNVADIIKNLLKEYKPLAGTFINQERFTSINRFNCYGDLGLDECLSRKAFPVAGHDQEVQVFSSSFAEIMFPSPYHGAGMSMWYSQWICYKQYPEKQLCFTEVDIRNTRADIHGNENKAQHIAGVDLVRLFNSDVWEKNYTRTLLDIQEENKIVHAREADKSPVHYQLDDLKKIYNVENYFFKYRQPLVQDKEQYISEVKKRLHDINTEHDNLVQRNMKALELDKQRKDAC
jgi:hypothetical protein